MAENTTNSLFTHLVCVECGKEYATGMAHSVCKDEDCKYILSAQS
jgi:hypothetical protein